VWSELERRLSVLKPRHWLLVLVALTLLVLLTRFVAVGWQRMLFNTDSVDGDQGAYLQLGLDLREHGVLTDGTRHPLYPLLLAAFAEREWRYFTYAKFLSLAFGMLGILALFWIGYRLFDLPTAWLAAFLLSINFEFIQHSTFVLAESLLVLCFLGAWFAMVRALRRPESVPWWAAAGGLAGLVYLAKGTGQLLAACFLLAAFLLYGPGLVRRRGVWVFLATYSLVALPLWIYNWKLFGSPTFNFAMTHQMWMDRWEQNLVSDVRKLPTFWSYWQSHTWQEAWVRLWKGLVDLRFFVAKILWPTRSLALDHFLLSIWSGVTLAVVAGAALAARRPLWAFVRQHRQAVVLTLVVSFAFYLLFAWYTAIVPLPTRFLLPLLPIWLLLAAATLAGVGRRVVTAKLPRSARLGAGLVALAIGLFIGRWFVISGLANAQAFGQNPFEADRVYNSDSEQPLQWVRTGQVGDPADVLVGPGSSLPFWRHSDHVRMVRLPVDLETPAEFEAYLRARDVEYAVLDAGLADRRGAAADWLGVREVEGDRVVLDRVPPGWALGFVYPDMPCKWCVLQRLADKPPADRTDFVLGQAIRLAGYDMLVDDLRPGGELALSLYWESLRPVDADYTVFTQLLGPDGQLHGQFDRQPLHGHWPTSRWQPGQSFVDKFVIPVDETAPPGEYTLLVGLYDLNTGQRLPVTAAKERVTHDAIALFTLTMEETSHE